MLNDSLFSSDKMDWETPDLLYQKLDAIYHFTVDVCASAHNAKHTNYWTEQDNALSLSWTGHRCWMNPPYGRSIGTWMKKAHQEVHFAQCVVCLVPARTDTAWWFDYARYGYITFLRGRLKFGNATNSAPFPSAIVVFDKNYLCRQELPSYWNWDARLPKRKKLNVYLELDL